MRALEHDWEVTPEPPAWWEDACARHASLFHGRAWQEMLAQSFGARPAYAWQRGSERGAAIIVFRAGPFRVGYVGFPIGGTLTGEPLLAVDVAALLSARRPLRADLVRLPVSAFAAAPPFDLPYAETPETAILDLPGWDVARAKKLARDVKKAGRSECRIAAARGPAQADAMYRLYRDTVARHRGSMRYGRAYFRGLVQLAQHVPAVRCLLAVGDAGIAAFAVLADDGRATYYLHAATNPAMKQEAASDLLLHAAIVGARERGMQRFNLMASPVEQPSLVRYKEKWGGVTAMQRTYELACRPGAARLFRTAMRVYGVLRHR